jgi:hypothetical protein
MKERPQTEKPHAGIGSNRSSFTGASNESPQLEEGHITVPPTMRNIDEAKAPVTASPDPSSSMAEFLEKEKLCKVSVTGRNVECYVDIPHRMTFAIICP